MNRFISAPENQTLSIYSGGTYLMRIYNSGDPVWKLDPEKQERKLIADLQRELTIRADELSNTQVVIRG